MAVIGETQIKAAYSAARQVYEKTATEHDAALSLESSVGMSQASAYDYVRVLGLMIAGKRYTRTINDSATRYYLQNIKRDYGNDALKSALAAVGGHIDYYESIRTARPSLRAILTEFNSTETLDSPADANSFDVMVNLASQLSDKELSERLPPRGSKPQVVLVTTKQFSRNPNVVAAVLRRAGGVCEKCQRPAPFVRRSDQAPYLEVHHIIRLADRGDDTLENAKALCPNCHRQAHFG